MDFYNVEEQTKYKLKISRPESIEKLTDWFMSHDEVTDLIGSSFYLTTGSSSRTFLCKSVIVKELEKWANALEASGKKTLRIQDPDLLDVLKDGNYITNFIDEKYGRHGDRICYARRYARVKKKPTKSDVREFWLRIFPDAFKDKFGAWPPYHTTYDRHLAAFRAWQKCLGWKACSRRMFDPEQKKFMKMIWDNPEEYV